jgi:hypothetical protein
VNQAPVLSLLIGVALLLFGRKLFWLFVGAAGFLFGTDLAGSYVAGPEGMKLLIAVIAGILCAVLAVFLQRIAVAIAGFIAGGYVAVELMRQFGVMPRAMIGAGHDIISFPYLLGGILGAVLIYLLFDWALIFLSSLCGSMLIVRNIVLKQASLMPILFLGLVAIGIFFQAYLFHRSRNNH